MNSEATGRPLPIFVYGTLMPGQPNAFIWRDSISDVEQAQISGCCLYDLRQYPVMVYREGYTVHGRLVWVAEEHFSQMIEDLDFFESFNPECPQDSLFRRVKVQVSTHDGRLVEAWVYMGLEQHVHDCRIIESGDWAEHVAARED